VNRKDLWPNQTAVRYYGRRALATILRAIPQRMLLRIRQSFVDAPAKSTAEQRYGRLLELLRHRGVPADVDAFPLVDNPGVVISNCDSFIVERLYWFGEAKGYEPEVVHWWRYFCKRSERVLELGTNIGYFAVQGAKANPSAHYTAVEPHPGAAAACRRNLEINRITNVELVEAAAVAVAGTVAASVELLLPVGRDHYVDAPCSGFVGTTEVHDAGETMPSSSYRSMTVEAVSLGSLTVERDLIKLDVEGQEHELLASVADVLRRERPTIFLELLDGTPTLRSFLVELCESLPYRCYVPTPTQLLPLSASAIPTVSLLEEYGTRDVVLTCDDPPANGSWSMHGAA
jgi:FkbM family methyltransferase